MQQAQQIKEMWLQNRVPNKHVEHQVHNTTSFANLNQIHTEDYYEKSNLNRRNSMGERPPEY